MSESMFLWRSNSRFIAAHPREEGWTVYEFASDTAREMYLHFLLDCLRDWHPDALKGRKALSFVHENALRKAFKKSQDSDGGFTKNSSDTVDSYGWRGDVELVWNGHDIHCQVFSLVIAQG